MPDHYLYADPSLIFFERVGVPGLSGFTERHQLQTTVPPLQKTADLMQELLRSGAPGIIIGLRRGWPGLSCLKFAGKVLRAGRKVWFYWPEEEAIECVDRERLRSMMRHWAFISMHEYLVNPLVRRRPRNQSIAMLRRDYRLEVAALSRRASPLPLAEMPGASKRISGTGVYLRTDFWAPLSSGGSYGHTCYLASALSHVTDNLV